MGKFTLNRDHKATMFSALGAFILSMLIGLIAGNSAAVVFVRAIVSALLFSAVVFGALYLLRRYIPEFQGGSEVGEAVQEGEADNKVNYDVSGEQGLKETLGETGTAAGIAALATEDEASPLSEGGETPMDIDAIPLSPLTASATPKMTKSLSEETEAAMEEALPQVDIPEDASLSGLEDITLDSAEENGNGDFEDLPSLDKLYEEHEQVSVPDIGTSDIASSDKSKKVGNYIEVGDARIPFEPEILAKAVKKVMKEDE